MSEQRVSDETIGQIIRGEGYAIPKTVFGVEDIETILACDLRDSRTRTETLKKALQHYRDKCPFCGGRGYFGRASSSPTDPPDCEDCGHCVPARAALGEVK